MAEGEQVRRDRVTMRHRADTVPRVSRRRRARSLRAADLAVRMRPPGPVRGAGANRGGRRRRGDLPLPPPVRDAFRGGGRRGATRQPAGLPDQPLRRDPAGRRRRVRLGALPSVGRAPFLRGSDARGRGSSHARGRGVAPPRCPRGRGPESRRPRPTRIGPARCRRFCGGVSTPTGSRTSRRSSARCGGTRAPLRIDRTASSLGPQPAGSRADVLRRPWA